MTLRRWESTWRSGDIAPVAAVVAVPADRLAIEAAPEHRAAAPNPGEYTGKLPVGEYTERLPVGERTQLLRDQQPQPELRSEGLLSGSRSDPPLFVEVKGKVNPWADIPADVVQGGGLADYDKACADMLAGYDRAAAQLFVDFDQRWRHGGPKQVTAA